MKWRSLSINFYQNNQSLYKINRICIGNPDIALHAVSLKTPCNESPENSINTSQVFEKISENDIIEVFIP